MRNFGGEPLSDEDLLAKFQAAPESGSGTAALDELLSRYHSRVAKWCFRYTGDTDTAADLAQDVLLRVYRNLDSFRGGSKFSTWLYTITRNHCLNEMKARSARPDGSSDALDFEIEDTTLPDVLADLQQKESLKMMRTLIDETLDETEKQVMTLHFAEEVSLDSVTRLLKLTNASGARAYVVSAKRKLNTAISRWKARQGRTS
jgi:RNA polymerase sigma-70 factor, ECF subfamily